MKPFPVFPGEAIEWCVVKTVKKSPVGSLNNSFNIKNRNGKTTNTEASCKYFKNKHIDCQEVIS